MWQPPSGDDRETRLASTAAGFLAKNSPARGEPGLSSSRRDGFVLLTIGPSGGLQNSTTIARHAVTCEQRHNGKSARPKPTAVTSMCNVVSHILLNPASSQMWSAARCPRTTLLLEAEAAIGREGACVTSEATCKSV